jgi:hypothetical protein
MRLDAEKRELMSLIVTIKRLSPAAGFTSEFWENMELQGRDEVRDLIMQGEATIRVMRECLSDRSDFALHSKRTAILQDLSTRLWSAQED